MPNLRAVAAALNGYPWTRGHLIRWRNSPPQYCAVGALLRWADVEPAEIAWADGLGAVVFWHRWGSLLGQAYGIPTLQSAHRIVHLNDAAESQAEAAALDRMGHTTPMDKLLTARQLRRFSNHGVMLACDSILAYNGHPCDGPPVPLRYPLPCRQRRPW